MSTRAAILAACLSASCSSPERAAPRPPDAPERKSAPEPARVAAQPIRPTPAFAPATEGRCAEDYALVEGTCVHLAYQASGAELTRGLADYKRGIAPPMLGPAVPKASDSDRQPARPLDPGALSRPADADADADAGSAKDRRLADLDAMLAVAREKLRERDESSKAKRVDGPAGGDAGTSVTRVVGGTTGGGAFEVTTPQDPMAARTAELDQLTKLMSSEQLKAMSGELGRLGIDPQQLDTLLKQARGGQTP